MTSNKTIITCLECGVMPCKRGAKKYCSLECSLENTAVQKQKFDTSYKHDLVPWNKGLSVHLSPKSEFKKGNSINMGRIREDRGEKNACWVKPRIRYCAQCSKKLELKPNQVKNRKRHFCNRICWALGTRGKGSPVFKGEKAVSRYRNRVAELPEYKEWHAAVLRRDNYKCVKCPAVQTKRTPLEVDHIKRFLFIVQENNLKTVEDARNCKELWDTSNGQTVCKPCHCALDTYGTKGLSKLINLN